MKNRSNEIRSNEIRIRQELPVYFLKFLDYNFVKIEKVFGNVLVYEIALSECQTFVFAWLPNTLHLCNLEIGAQNVLTFLFEKFMYFEN